MADLQQYYKTMSSSQIMQEFNEMVAEWQRDGWNVDRRALSALTAIWFEMESRGTRLPTAPELAGGRDLPDW